MSTTPPAQLPLTYYPWITQHIDAVDLRQAVNDFASAVDALRPGAYLRIIVEGDVAVGDEIRVVSRPPHDLTVADMFRIYARDRGELERLLAVPQVSADWRSWAEEMIRKRRARDPAG